MSYAIWLSFFSCNIITSITPGPMNIVAMNAAGNFGMSESRRIFAGLISGLALVILLCGLFSTAFAAILPDMVRYMKYIGAAYILWIAYAIVKSDPQGVSAQTGELNFVRAFLFQFVNVKAYIWAITVYTAYVLPYYSGTLAILGFALIMTLIATLCALIWALAGAILNSFLKKYWQAANIAMALLLVYSAISLLIT